MEGWPPLSVTIHLDPACSILYPFHTYLKFILDLKVVTLWRCNVANVTS